MLCCCFCSYALFFDLPYPVMKHYCSLVLLSNNIYFWWLMAESANEQKGSMVGINYCFNVAVVLVFCFLYLVATNDLIKWNHHTTKLRPVFSSFSRWCQNNCFDLDDVAHWLGSLKLNSRLRHFQIGAYNPEHLHGLHMIPSRLWRCNTSGVKHALGTANHEHGDHVAFIITWNITKTLVWSKWNITSKHRCCICRFE
jgi:hypothetical protein